MYYPTFRPSAAIKNLGICVSLRYYLFQPYLQHGPSSHRATHPNPQKHILGSSFPPSQFLQTLARYHSKSPISAGAISKTSLQPIPRQVGRHPIRHQPPPGLSFWRTYTLHIRLWTRNRKAHSYNGKANTRRTCMQVRQRFSTRRDILAIGQILISIRFYTRHMNEISK